MNQITNSAAKEEIRLKNESVAKNREAQITAQLHTDLDRTKPYSYFVFMIVGGIVGLFTGSLDMTSFSAILGGVICYSLNKKVNSERKQLEDRANHEIHEEYARADRRAQKEIETYDREVKMYAQKILSNPGIVAPMVDHTVDMFQRMISHADAGSNMRFIEADFTYQVTNEDIQYSYQSTYMNPIDSYDFDRERYRKLTSPSECEGLAQALAKLTIAKMKNIYPPNSINISLSHYDARVTLHFKGANKNFVPARNIM